MGDNRGFFYCHLMSPNVTQSVSVSAMLRYGKKTDQDVFEPTMWKKEVRRLSGGQEINLDISYDA